jgi:hypothetical protein
MTSSFCAGLPTRGPQHCPFLLGACRLTLMGIGRAAGIRSHAAQVRTSIGIHCGKEDVIPATETH